MATKPRTDDGIATTDPAPNATRLDTDVTKPSTVVAGDAPADTTDPTERASTVGGDKAAAALAGHLTVNAVVPMPPEPKLPDVTDGEKASWEYQGAAARFVKAEQRMTLEQAKAFGAIYGVCCNCGATLTDETSIEAGIGPVCAGRFAS